MELSTKYFHRFFGMAERERQAVKVAIMLGGNLGDTEKIFDSAVAAFIDGGLKLIGRSAIYRSAPVDCVPGTPEFSDQALTGSWNGTAEELLALCQQLERAAGRVETGKWLIPVTFSDPALVGKWPGSAHELLKLCQQLERAAGRPEIHSSCEARTLDCDIIIFGDTVSDSPALTLPHPRAKMRRFVLEPLAEIAPDWRFPDSGTTVLQELGSLKH